MYISNRHSCVRYWSLIFEYIIWLSQSLNYDLYMSVTNSSFTLTLCKKRKGEVNVFLLLLFCLRKITKAAVWIYINTFSWCLTNVVTQNFLIGRTSVKKSTIMYKKKRDESYKKKTEKKKPCNLDKGRW